MVQHGVPAAAAPAAAHSEPSGTPTASAGAPGTPREQPAAAVAEAGPASPPEAAAGIGEPSSQGAAAAEEEQVEVSLQTGEDGEVSFKLTLSPSKIAAAAAAAAGEAEADAVHEVDPGHMPSSPAAGSATRPAARRRSEALQPRPGALHDSAARGE